MSGSRQRPALGHLPDVTRFPRSRLRADVLLYRAHTLGNSPWWFSSDLTGRFDLTAPNGTCYLATDLTAALRERFGHALVRQAVVTFEAAARTVVSTVRAPDARWLANICSSCRVPWNDREIGTCPSYRLPQAWAAAFFGTGRHAGIRYQTRFSTSASANAVALFDDAGQHDWPVDPSPLGGVQACRQAGISAVHRPTRRQVRIQPPPA